jgi:hypothetical protein
MDEVNRLQSIFGGGGSSALDQLTRSQESARRQREQEQNEAEREARRAQSDALRETRLERSETNFARREASYERAELRREQAEAKLRKKSSQGVDLEISAAEYLAAKGHSPERFARSSKEDRLKLLGAFYADTLRPQVNRIAAERGYTAKQKVSFEQNLRTGAFADLARSHSYDSYVPSTAYIDAWQRRAANRAATASVAPAKSKGFLSEAQGVVRQAGAALAEGAAGTAAFVRSAINQIETELDPRSVQAARRENTLRNKANRDFSEGRLTAEQLRQERSDSRSRLKRTSARVAPSKDDSVLDGFIAYAKREADFGFSEATKDSTDAKDFQTRTRSAKTISDTVSAYAENPVIAAASLFGSVAGSGGAVGAGRVAALKGAGLIANTAGKFGAVRTAAQIKQGVAATSKAFSASRAAVVGNAAGVGGSVELQARDELNALSDEQFRLLPAYRTAAEELGDLPPALIRDYTTRALVTIGRDVGAATAVVGSLIGAGTESLFSGAVKAALQGAGGNVTRAVAREAASEAVEGAGESAALDLGRGRAVDLERAAGAAVTGALLGGVVGGGLAGANRLGGVGGAGGSPLRNPLRRASANPAPVTAQESGPPNTPSGGNPLDPSSPASPAPRPLPPSDGGPLAAPDPDAPAISALLGDVDVQRALNSPELVNAELIAATENFKAILNETAGKDQRDIDHSIEFADRLSTRAAGGFASTDPLSLAAVSQEALLAGLASQDSEVTASIREQSEAAVFGEDGRVDFSAPRDLDHIAAVAQSRAGETRRLKSGNTSTAFAREGSVTPEARAIAQQSLLIDSGVPAEAAAELTTLVSGLGRVGLRQALEVTIEDSLGTPLSVAARTLRALEREALAVQRAANGLAKVVSLAGKPGAKAEDILAALESASSAAEGLGARFKSSDEGLLALAAGAPAGLGESIVQRGGGGGGGGGLRPRRPNNPLDQLAVAPVPGLILQASSRTGSLPVDAARKVAAKLTSWFTNYDSMNQFKRASNAALNFSGRPVDIHGSFRNAALRVREARTAVTQRYVEPLRVALDEASAVSGLPLEQINRDYGLWRALTHAEERIRWNFVNRTNVLSVAALKDFQTLQGRLKDQNLSPRGYRAGLEALFADAQSYRKEFQTPEHTDLSTQFVRFTNPVTGLDDSLLIADIPVQLEALNQLPYIEQFETAREIEREGYARVREAQAKGNIGGQFNRDILAAADFKDYLPLRADRSGDVLDTEQSRDDLNFRNSGLKRSMEADLGSGVRDPGDSLMFALHRAVKQSEENVAFQQMVQVAETLTRAGGGNIGVVTNALPLTAETRDGRPTGRLSNANLAKVTDEDMFMARYPDGSIKVLRVTDPQVLDVLTTQHAEEEMPGAFRAVARSVTRGFSRLQVLHPRYIIGTALPRDAIEAMLVATGGARGPGLDNIKTQIRNHAERIKDSRRVFEFYRATSGEREKLAVKWADDPAMKYTLERYREMGVISFTDQLGGDAQLLRSDSAAQRNQKPVGLARGKRLISDGFAAIGHASDQTLGALSTTLDSIGRDAAYATLRESGVGVEAATNLVRNIYDPSHRTRFPGVRAGADWVPFLNSAFAGQHAFLARRIWKNGVAPTRETRVSADGVTNTEQQIDWGRAWDELNYPAAAVSLGLSTLSTGAMYAVGAALMSDDEDRHPLSDVPAVQLMTSRGVPLGSDNAGNLAVLKVPSQYGLDMMLHALGTGTALVASGTHSVGEVATAFADITAQNLIPLGKFNAEAFTDAWGAVALSGGGVDADDLSSSGAGSAVQEAGRAFMSSILGANPLGAAIGQPILDRTPQGRTINNRNPEDPARIGTTAAAVQMSEAIDNAVTAESIQHVAVSLGGAYARDFVMIANTARRFAEDPDYAGGEHEIFDHPATNFLTQVRVAGRNGLKREADHIIGTVFAPKAAAYNALKRTDFDNRDTSAWWKSNGPLASKYLDDNPDFSEFVGIMEDYQSARRKAMAVIQEERHNIYSGGNKPADHQLIHEAHREIDKVDEQFIVDSAKFTPK